MDRLARRRTARESASERGSYTHESERGSTCEQRKREILRDRESGLDENSYYAQQNKQSVCLQTNKQSVCLHDTQENQMIMAYSNYDWIIKMHVNTLVGPKSNRSGHSRIKTDR